jgi:hypothetical protein
MTARKAPPAKPLRPTPDVPPETRAVSWAEVKAWHTLKHAPPPPPSWDATGLVVALMLLACLALGGVVEAFAHAHGVLGL